MKEIPLTKGAVAIVDDEDYEQFTQHHWHYSGGYASRWICRPRATARVDNRPRLIGVRMHNVIMNPPPGMEVDHINGNRADNRRVNLRIVNRQQQSENRRKSRHGGHPLFKGVYCRNERFYAAIHTEGKLHHLGSFGNALEAALAYD